MSKTACGEGSHGMAALWHGMFAALYVGALYFHAMSVLVHWRRRRGAP